MSGEELEYLEWFPIFGFSKARDPHLEIHIQKSNLS